MCSATHRSGTVRRGSNLKQLTRQCLGVTPGFVMSCTTAELLHALRENGWFVRDVEEAAWA
jgi:hypothetical protein